MKIRSELLKNIDPRLKRRNNLYYLKGSGHRVKLPELNEELALFLGLLWGDGWLLNRKMASKNSDWRIGIVEDDRLLINQFVSLCERVFNIKPGLNDRITKVEAYFNSRIVYEIVNKVFKFPDGEKRGRLRVPKLISQNEVLSKSFLKGLFSTDGRFVVYKSPIC